MPTSGAEAPGTAAASFRKSCQSRESRRNSQARAEGNPLAMPGTILPGTASGARSSVRAFGLPQG